MDNSKKILTLFNKRAKLLYLNGFTKFQILNELQIFYEKIDENDLAKIDLDNFIFSNNSDKLQLNRKIKQHFCNHIYFDEHFDDYFEKINKICKNVNVEESNEFKLIDNFLDNPRIAEINDITLSSAISIYKTPFLNTKINKDNFIDLINNIMEDYENNIIDNMEDNLLLYENAFLNLDYSISKVEDRVEIYQELIILISKLAQLYNLEADILLKYLDIYLCKIVKDLIILDDREVILNTIRTIYNNIDFSSFFILLPFFLENFSPSYIKIVMQDLEDDIFVKKDQNFLIIKNILLFSSAELSPYKKSLDENIYLEEFNKNLSLLEFAINFESRDTIYYYWNKVKNSGDYCRYEDIVEEVENIVENFNRVEELTSHLKKLTINNISQQLIEIEQLNYLNSRIYSCAINRVYYYYFDSKSFNFVFLLILLNLGLEDKASIYFYHNINYINWDEVNFSDIFTYANILFLINAFDFTSELLIKLYSVLKKSNKDKYTTLLDYVIIELKILKNLMIPVLNNKDWDEVILEEDDKEII
ncbi:MAG: hypothetical protein PQJ45_09135 [Sphaerochaetaceae bacterium]|nr:hypothetical protein [Sphaerochaetaceae bacterium]MDC7237920.1 hypothetical protein [Sphaerochaetaceae bacterium]